jgi:hypothetical protein
MNSNTQDKPGIIAPPPLIYLAGFGMGLLLHRLLPLALLPGELYFARDKMKLLRISGKSWTAITSSTSIGRLSNAQAGV